jgi:hypothetical protein
LGKCHVFERAVLLPQRTFDKAIFFNDLAASFGLETTELLERELEIMAIIFLLDLGNLKLAQSRGIRQSAGRSLRK